MRLISEIKAYFVKIDVPGIETVIVGDTTMVNQSVLNNMVYPLLWVMYPFEREKLYNADVPKVRWNVELLVLKHAKPDETTVIEQNFDDCQVLGEALLSKMRADSKLDFGKSFAFDEVSDVKTWMPKEQYGMDNCNGWLIPLSFLTT
jgi:hypothetical protein